MDKGFVFLDRPGYSPCGDQSLPYGRPSPRRLQTYTNLLKQITQVASEYVMAPLNVTSRYGAYASGIFGSDVGLSGVGSAMCIISLSVFL
jgi:hypothetical protein